MFQGLGAPVGAILAGPRDFISTGVRCRQALGGEMLKTGMLAAAGKLSLFQKEILEEDHRNAKTFAQGELHIIVFENEITNWLPSLLRVT